MMGVSERAKVPLISIVVPAFKDAFLAECIEFF